MSSQPPPLPTNTPKRHGCLTTWLVLMIITNAVTAVATPLSLSSMQQAGLNVSPFQTGIIILCAIANVFFAVALLKWKRWGFYGFIVTSLVALVSNLSIGLGIGQSLFGLIGIGVLYWVLNMGGAEKAWPRLK